MKKAKSKSNKAKGISAKDLKHMKGAVNLKALCTLSNPGSGSTQEIASFQMELHIKGVPGF
jgi:hypothetical protein